MSERTEQEALFDFLARMEGRYPLLKWVFHVPNQASGGGAKVRTSYTRRDGTTGYRMTPVEALTNARMGTKKGIPDIFAPFGNIGRMPRDPYQHYIGLVIELKTETGITSDEQVAWLEFLASQGWYTDVCRGWLAAARLFITWVGGDPNEIEGL